LNSKRKKKTVTDTIHNFLSQCDDIGLSVREKKPEAWQEYIQHTLKNINASKHREESLRLRQQVTECQTSLATDNRALDSFREDAQKLEKELIRFSSSIAELQSDIRDRGFQPDALPNGEQLKARLTLTQNKLEEDKRKHEENKQELEQVVQKLAGTKVSLSQKLQDVSAKETHLQDCDSIWTKFTMKCNAAGVDFNTPADSMAIRRSVSEKDLRTLDQIERNRQELLQLSTFEELRDQAKTLHDKILASTKEIEKVTSHHTYISEWSVRLDNLLLEVSKQQVLVVGTHLEKLGPIIQEIYTRLNPHPFFQDIKIHIDEKKRELFINVEGEGTATHPSRITVQPKHFFSDAQLNVLAISVFLAGALSQRWSGLQTVFIDDPIQQLDEMNVCSFLDLLRGLKDTRQFIVFTCSRDFYLLALDKLSCLNKVEKGSFLAYRLENGTQSTLKIHCDTAQA